METDKKILQDFNTTFDKMYKTLEERLVNRMNEKNIGMISFLPSGAFSTYDLPRVFAIIDNPSDPTSYVPVGNEIAAVVNINNKIYVVLDCDLNTDFIIDTLEEYTHFTKDCLSHQDNFLKREVKDTLYPYETMMKLFETTSMAIDMIKEPLTENIHADDIP